VSRLLNVPYSVTAHADDIFNEPVLTAEKLSEARFCITVSEFNRAHLLQTYPMLESKKLVVLHPWIDLSRFSAPAARPEQERFCILSVGRLVENKGHQYFIEACHLLRKEGLNFEGHIIGEGPLRPELEARIAHYDLQGIITLLGQQPQSVVLDYLCRANVFVLACTVAENGARDGMPVAIAEAMAMMVPVISTEIVGIGEMVRPGTGYLVPDKDSHALAEAIRKVYQSSPSLRTEMGFYGRTVIAENFDLHSGVRKLAFLFARSAFEGGVS
jgi:glycosyltransferase involved in cell wall biosynthesis